jgi:hypothetical protein
MSHWRYPAYVIILIVLISFPLYTGVYLLNVMGIILIYLSLALSWDSTISRRFRVSQEQAHPRRRSPREHKHPDRPTWRRTCRAPG